MRVLRLEEERFLETLERGLKLFEELGEQDAISGEQAFTLAATYGFPLELTAELAEERGQAVDVDGYRVEMERHRDVSRAVGSSERAARGRLRAQRRLHHGVRRVREDRRPHADRRVRGSRATTSSS